MPKYKVLAPWRVLTALGLVALAAVSSLAQQDEAVLQRMKKDITFLASEVCEGRNIGTKGIDIAADYIVNELKQAGLKAGGKDGSWFQPFTYAAKGAKGAGKVEGVNTLVLKGPIGQTIELGSSDFEVLPMSASGKISGPMVFAGYGVTVPADEGSTPKDGAGYDDFKGIDVAGKIVVVLRRVPRWDNEVLPFGGAKEKYAGLENKFANAELHKAAAILIVNDRSEKKDGDKFMATPGLRDNQVPVAQLRRGVLDMLLITGNGAKLIELEEDIDRDLKPRSTTINGWTATLTTNVKRAPGIVCKNIIGVLEGAGPLANETVVIGAHYDHLGFTVDRLLAKGKGKAKDAKQEIHPGADDNGSGTTSIIEVARYFGAIKNRQGRRLVFIWFSAEEKGLIGSQYYCNNPIYPLEKTVAMVNLDMVGRLKNDKVPELYAEGFDTGKGLKELLNKLNAEYNFKIVGPHPEDVYGRSDQASFYRKKVPGLFFFTDFHDDYHRPGDTANKINVAGMAKVASLAEKVVAYLAETPQRPEFAQRTDLPPKKGKGGQKKDAKKDAGDGKKDAGDGKKEAGKDTQKKGDEEPPPLPLLRMQPDYEDESNKGMLIDDVIDGGPASKAGILPGDRITAINGVATPNLEVYMTVLRRHKSGVPLEVTIDRNGKVMKLKVTPE